MNQYMNRNSLVDLDLPIRITGEGHPGDGTSEVGRIVAAKNQLAARYGARGAVEPEREDILVDQLARHHVVPDGNSKFNGNVCESHAKDAIEMGSHKGKTGFGRGFAKDLALGSSVIRTSDDTNIPSRGCRQKSQCRQT